ncbi:GNAT family N-acetyltransferase [Halioglobus maricola]|uniref:GNAT family N-acetyltransferase n=1 Tax=Halioglobus maricola TaxID=2601894 RepID=A0A5P9NJR3_9GAMM|nr:GNAT family N-acetyltransferase [Halioglobus maricola]QFU75819.1 GNAT family N-acetyltransferase [Halioglobus maricola]
MEVTFRSFSANDVDACLALFDMNCPEYFAPNERVDYAKFLHSTPRDYEVCLVADGIVGAFGLVQNEPGQSSIDWILLSSNMQGTGIGTIIMNRVIGQARDNDVKIIHIATSHKAHQFFAKFGATIVSETKDGWGEGMHKIDMELRI